MKAAVPPITLVPQGHILYAIGDIHGRRDLLARLLSLIVQDLEQRRDWAGHAELIFLGDYIDRGMDSRGVIDFILHDLPTNMGAVFIRGNHEQVLLDVLDGDVALLPNWLHFGGTATLASYGITRTMAGDAVDYELLHKDLLERFPDQHRKFLENTCLSCTRGDYFFSHAGVRPDLALDSQTAEDLMWIRHGFLRSSQWYGKMVVHGHTISETPEIHNNRIGIDTGAYATGCLTCLALSGQERRFIAT